MSGRDAVHVQWSSRWAFILAATGSAVGLGNIWKFPYIAGEYGGGAFVLVYLLCIALIGIPIMTAEVLIGRRGRRSPVGALARLAVEGGMSRHWRLIGWMGIVAGFLILSFYSVVAGWALAYVFQMQSGVFSGADSELAGALFTDLLASPDQLMLWHTVFMGMTIFVVARGVLSGLERAVTILMPLLLVLLLLLVGYGLASGGFPQAITFMFTPDFSKLTTTAVLVAMGHAFFTLSLGMGAIMVYGSYLPQSASIPKTVVTVGVMDTVVALLAGLAIFPIVFSQGMSPAEGPGLIFMTLPVAFGSMPGGTLFGTLFFILLVFAAWTSAISLIEPVTAWMEENTRLSRPLAAGLCGGLAWLLGIGTVLSFNLWQDHTFMGQTFFGVLDFLTSNILLPLGGLLIAIFAGWLMQREATRDELGVGDGIAYRAWRLVVRYLAPLGIGLVVLHVMGVI